jgi:hypothetical protein
VSEEICASSFMAELQIRNDKNCRRVKGISFSFMTYFRHFYLKVITYLIRHHFFHLIHDIFSTFLLESDNISSVTITSFSFMTYFRHFYLKVITYLIRHHFFHLIHDVFSTFLLENDNISHPSPSN